ncbi:hypothetical protein PRZ48_014508 [Zasmidium cellare]|uniref:Uncharacterized protein n=1 Tax=Zasmidium cellare TaxID=395010 RepID=A0ABR0DYJ2_ZASCE|nr:hypothetical protein PRZ48_014508 [Zasmidium cellare]
MSRLGSRYALLALPLLTFAASPLNIEVKDKVGIDDLLEFPDLLDENGTSLKCVECKASGEFEVKVNIDFEKTPELDRMIDEIDVREYTGPESMFRVKHEFWHEDDSGQNDSGQNDSGQNDSGQNEQDHHGGDDVGEGHVEKRQLQLLIEPALIELEAAVAGTMELELAGEMDLIELSAEEMASVAGSVPGAGLIPASWFSIGSGSAADTAAEVFDMATLGIFGDITGLGRKSAEQKAREKEERQRKKEEKRKKDAEKKVKETIKKIEAKTGRPIKNPIDYHEIKTYKEYLAWEAYYKYEYVSPKFLQAIVNDIEIELPVEIKTPGKPGSVWIKRDEEPFDPMTEEQKKILQAWRTSSDILLKRAMELKGATLAAATLKIYLATKTSGVTHPKPSAPPERGGRTGEGDLPPPKDEECDTPWNNRVSKWTGKPPIKKHSFRDASLILRALSPRSDEDEASDNWWDRTGDWIRSHVSSATISIEATNDLTAAFQFRLIAPHDVKVAVNVDCYGPGRYAYSSALSLSPEAGTSVSWKPNWKYAKKDKSQKVKSPYPWKNLNDLPAGQDGKKFETKLGGMEFLIAPFSLDVKIGAKGQTNLTLPGFSATIAKGSIYSINLLGDEITHNTFSPSLISLDGKDHNDKDGKPVPEEFSLSVGLGTKIELKLLPGLKGPKKPKNKCIESFTDALKWLTKAAAAKVFESGKKAKEELPKPSWLNRKNIKDKGFGDPLSIGARADWTRLDWKFKEVKDVDADCNKNGSMHKALQAHSIFRQGFTPYANLFFWKVDPSPAGKVDKGKDATVGLFKSWKMGKHCYALDDAEEAFKQVGNVTTTAKGLGEGKVDAAGEGDGDEDEDASMKEFGKAFHREQMAMAANDTVKLLAPYLQVDLAELGMSSNATDVEYTVGPEELGESS